MASYQLEAHGYPHVLSTVSKKPRDAHEDSNDRNNFGVPLGSSYVEISPSLKSLRAREQVLHSIFSPGFRGGDQFTVHTNSAFDTSKSFASPPWLSAKKNTSHKKKKEHWSARSSNNYHNYDTPYFNTSQQINWSPASTKTTNKSKSSSPNSVITDSKNNSLFFSPSQTIASSLAESTHTSHKKEPTYEMISFDYISNCQSASDLKIIISFLKAKQQFSSLLRTAEQQYHKIRQETQQKHGRTEKALTTVLKPDHYTQSGHLHNKISQYLENESSLNMTLSFADEEEAQQKANFYAGRSQIGVGTSRTPAFPRQRIQQQQENRHKELYVQVERLTKEIEDMKRARSSDQSDFRRQLKALEDVNSRAKENIQHMQFSQTAASNQAKELRRSLEQQQNENDNLRTVLNKEYEERQRKEGEAKDIEQQLATRVQELSQQLESAQRKNGAVYEKRNRELHEMLESAQRNLEEMKKEQDETIQLILNATGRKVPDLKILSKTDRANIIADVSKQFQSTKAALDAVAENLNEVEKERRKAIKERRLAESELIETKMSKEQLELVNHNLSKKIERQAKEVGASRLFAEVYITSAHEQQKKHWEARDSMYKEMIQKLKSQPLHKSVNMVSADLYESKVTEAQQNFDECQKHIREVSDLRSEVDSLKTKLKKDSVEQNIPAPSAIKSSSGAEKLPVRTPTLSPKELQVRFDFASTATQDNCRHIRSSKIDKVVQKHSAKTPIRCDLVNKVDEDKKENLVTKKTGILVRKDKAESDQKPCMPEGGAKFTKGSVPVHASRKPQVERAKRFVFAPAVSKGDHSKILCAAKPGIIKASIPSIQDKENCNSKIASTPPTQKSIRFEFKPVTAKKSNRKHMVRAVGGREGLQNLKKQIRIASSKKKPMPSRALLAPQDLNVRDFR